MTLVFCEADLMEITNIKRILRCFEVMSSLKINCHKSTLSGVGVDKESLNDFANILNCEAKPLPIMYLGLPLGENPGVKSTWKLIADKIKSRLASWKRRYLSLGVRVTLIKSVFNSLPIYYFSLFKIPEGVAKEIYKIPSRFLWGGCDNTRKIHWVKWDKVTCSRDFKGLNIRKIRVTNECLLLKWWWSYGVEKEAL